MAAGLSGGGAAVGGGGAAVGGSGDTTVGGGAVGKSGGREAWDWVSDWAGTRPPVSSWHHSDLKGTFTTLTNN